MNAVHRVQHVVCVRHLGKMLVVSNANHNPCKKVSNYTIWKHMVYTGTCNVANEAAWQTHHLKFNPVSPLIHAEKASFGFNQFNGNTSIGKGSSKKQVAGLGDGYLLDELE
jgi:hypothetical protein